MDPSTSSSASSAKKRSSNPSTSKNSKRFKPTQHPDKIYCNECCIEIKRQLYQGHLRSQSHKKKCSKPISTEEGVELIKTAFKSRIVSYKILNNNEPDLNVHNFLDQSKPKISRLLSSVLNDLTSVKINFEQFADYYLEKQDLVEVKSFATKNIIVTVGSDFNTIFNEECDLIKKKMQEFQERGSGWTLKEILHLEFNVNKFSPWNGSSYMPLPENILKKKAVTNIQNNDSKCFMWCILAALHPAEKNPQRVSKYSAHISELNFNGIDFPVKLTDISLFENQNEISINVYGYDEEKDIIIGPLYHTKSKCDKHVNLLLITNGENGESHYCLINNMSRLISSQISKHKSARYFCDGCFLTFTVEENFERHGNEGCGKLITKLPSSDIRTNKLGEESPGNELKFKHYERSLKIPFCIYADFESLLQPIKTCNPNENSTSSLKTNMHVPYSFAYNIKCSYDDSLSIFKTYRGRDCTKKFNDWLTKDIKRIYKDYLKLNKDLDMSLEDNTSFENSTECHICEKPFTTDDKKVRDHCHLTSKFRGAAHSKCNLNYKIPEFIPMFCHNLSGYDCHLFIKDFAEKGSSIDVIAQNKERYISFSKHILVEETKDKNTYLQLRCLDSFRFMPSSLDKLAKNLSAEDCNEVRRHFTDEQKFRLMRQKGIFPYSYVDCFEKLDDDKLPDCKHFKDDLNLKDISEEDYNRASKVWNCFNCKTLGEYSDIYLKQDVLLLTDIFEKFRSVCLEIYKLDPAQYYTSPGLSWDALLRHTNVKLELLTDIGMVDFFKKGIRGGICQCSKRLAEANNRFVPHYDKTKPKNYIMYLDATNLYGAAMSELLPTGGFRWLNEVEIASITSDSILNDKSDKGYVFEVDIEYPEELHDLHNDLPFCAENIVPPNSSCSKKKLIVNLFDKSNYIIHCQNLKQILSHKLKLKKIHRVLEFNQSRWMQPYIELNSKSRNAAQNSFEKDFFKLMNNSVFGKTMENVDKYVDVKLVTHWDYQGRKPGAAALIANPRFKNISVFTEDFCAIQMNKTVVTYNKPIYVGFSVLEISKFIMYDFFYGFIKEKYKSDVSLCYMDTDSFILDVKTPNFYDDMKQHLVKFDTSNYDENNRHGVPKMASVIGRMKDEYKGSIIWTFVGTGAKAYCVDVEGELTQKAKGVKRCVTEKLTSDDYKNAASNPDSSIIRKMSIFRSYKHQVYTVEQNKVALSYDDDKRVILKDYKTLSWGHKSLKKK